MRTSSYDLADRVFEGRLAERLAEWRDEQKMSLADVAFHLRTEHGIAVSIETVRRWLDRIKNEKVA